MIKTIYVDVFFYENARKSPPHGNVYRPHFVVDDSDGCHLGIQFIDLDLAPFGEHILAEVELVYPGVDYSPLKENARFLIIEAGSQTVGEGVVVG